jgi:UDP-N-acetyl-D-glucosamine dehydrogenase
MTPACVERAAELYGRICDHIVRVSTPEAAELTKLLENIFRSVNIALVNELAILAERMGIDIWEVVDAASTKPYGFMRFEPGPGMGGHCLPVDPFYLTWRAREFQMSTEFIELAGKINQQMPYHCAERIERALNGAGKPVNGSRILLLGASYKGAVGDTRESPALRIIQVLRDLGGIVSYHDEHVPTLPELGLESVLLETAVPEADAVVLVTAHPGLDYAAIAGRSSLFVDLRGVTRGVDVENLVRL